MNVREKLDQSQDQRLPPAPCAGMLLFAPGALGSVVGAAGGGFGAVVPVGPLIWWFVLLPELLVKLRFGC